MSVEWNARLVRGDLGGEIARLRAEPGAPLGLGGAELAATFMQQGWIDEYWLFANPVLLGSGRRLFPPLDGTATLRLAETRSFGSGVVYLDYRRTVGDRPA